MKKYYFNNNIYKNFINKVDIKRIFKTINYIYFVTTIIFVTQKTPFITSGFTLKYVYVSINIGKRENVEDEAKYMI